MTFSGIDVGPTRESAATLRNNRSFVSEAQSVAVGAASGVGRGSYLGSVASAVQTLVATIDSLETLLDQKAEAMEYAAMGLVGPEMAANAAIAETTASLSSLLGATMANPDLVALMGVAPAGGSLDAEAQAEAYAEYLLELNKKGDSYEVKTEKVEEVAAFLEEHADDPEVLEAFFAKLGTEGTLAVPNNLVNLLSGVSRSDLSQQILEDGTPLRVKVLEAQDRLMSAFGVALGNASTADVLPKEFATELAKRVTSGNFTEGWALSEVLRHGTYDADFLVDIAVELDDFERNDGWRGMWRNRVPSDPSGTTYALGVEHEEQYFDPFVGLFEAMSRTPDAALDFLYPGGAAKYYPPGGDGTKVSDRARYYIQERVWSHDDFDALGQMLEGAALAHRTYDDPRSELSALAASDAINLLGTRAGPGWLEGKLGAGDQKIGDAAYDSLGNILSVYILDVDTAFNFSEPTGRVPFLADTPEFANFPPGALFDRKALQLVLSETLTDNRALQAVLESAGELNNTRVSAAIGVLGSSSPSKLDAAINFNSKLLGAIIGAAGYGNIADAQRDADRGKLINSAIQNTAGIIPIPGSSSFAKYIASKAIGQVNLAPTNQVGGAKDEAWDLQTTVTQGALTNVGAQLGEAGMLDVRPTRNSPPYPWFDPVYMGPQVVGYKFNSEKALHPDNVSEFEAALISDSNWGDSLGDVEGDVNDGIEKGLKGHFG